MATGDILSPAILGSTDYNAFSAQIDFDDLSAASLAYSAGLAANLIPTADTGFIDVESEGFDGAAQPIAVARRIHLTRILRLPYDQHANLDIVDASGDARAKFALSDDIYAGDVGCALTIPGGRVSDGVNGNVAASAVAIANNSTLPYPKAYAQWDNEGVPGGYRVREDFTIGCIAVHTHGVACVRFTATGATSAHSVSVIATAPVARLYPGSGLYGWRHEALIPIAGFTQGERIDLRCEVFPVIGDASSVFDTADYAADLEITGRSPVSVWCNKTGALDVFAVVDQATGNDATGVSSATLATAEANRYLSVGQAIEDGANEIYYVDGAHPMIGTIPAARTGPDHYVEVKPHPTLATPGGVVAIVPTANRTYRTVRLKFEGGEHGIIIRPAGAQAYLSGATNDTNPATVTQFLWIDGCTFDSNSFTASGPGLNDRSTGFYVTNCFGDFGPNLWKVGQFSTRWSTIWARGNTFSETSGADNTFSNWYSWVANKQVGSLGLLPRPTTGSAPDNDGAIFLNNEHLDCNRTGAPAIGFGTTPVAVTIGRAFIGSLIEHTGGGTALAAICSDVAPFNHVRNIVIAHNTWVGQRQNLFYNSDGSTRYERLGCTARGNFFQNRNIKSDTFAPGNAARTGGWPALYGGRFSANHCVEATFPWEFDGFNSSQGDPLFVQDNSASGLDGQIGSGDGSGMGDYTPGVGSPLLNRLRAEDIMAPCDLYGNPIEVGGSIGAIQPEADVDTDPPEVSSPVGFATGATSATIGLTTNTGEGTLHGVLSASATPPSKPDLKAGAGALWSGSAPVDSPGAKTLSPSGLAPSTVYFGHLLHTDASDNDSDIVTTGEIVTGDLEPLESAGPRLPDGPIFMLWPVPGWDCPADHPVLYDPRVVLQGAYQINRLDTAPSNAHVPSWLGEIDIDIPVDATHGQTGRYTAVAAPATEADFRVNGAAAAKKTLLWIRAIHAKYDAPYGRRRPFNIWINNWGYEATNSRVWHRDAADNLLSATPRQDRSPFFASALALWRAFGEEFADTLDALMTPEEKAAPYTSHADLEESMSDRYAMDAASGVGEGFIPLFDGDLPSAPHASDVARWENEVVYFGGVTMRDLWLASRDFVADQWSNNQSFGALSNIAAKGARPDSPPYWFGRTFGFYENMPVRTWWQSLTRLTRGYAWWRAMVEPLQAVLPGLTRTSNWTCARIAPYVHQKVSGLSGLATDFYSRMHANAGFEHGYTHDNYVAYDANAEIASGFTTPDFEALIAEATPEQAALLKRVNGYVHMTSSFAGERRVKPRSLWIREPDPNQVVASSGMPQDMWLAMVRLLHRRNTPDLLIFINATGADPALRPLTTVANLDRLHAALQALRPASAPSPRERAFRGRGAAIAALAGALS